MNTVFTLGLAPDVIEHLKGKGVVSEPAPAELSQLAKLHPNGVVLTSQLRPELNETLAAHDGIKAILLAGPGERADIVPDLLRQHWFGYFTPPFDWDEISSAVHEAAAIQSWSDGIELLSARPNWLTLQVRCRRYTAERLVRFVRELVADLPAAERERVGAAFREIVLNGMEHGAQFDSAKHLCVSYLRTNRFVMYTVRDPGAGFDFGQLPHAAISNPPGNPAQHMLVRAQQGIRAGGFGLMVARDLVDEMLHNESGNEVVLVKYLDNPTDGRKED